MKVRTPEPYTTDRTRETQAHPGDQVNGKVIAHRKPIEVLGRIWAIPLIFMLFTDAAKVTYDLCGEEPLELSLREDMNLGLQWQTVGTAR